MIVYLLILLFILFGVFNFDLLNNKAGKNLYIIFSFIFLALMSAFRYRVGGDSIAYEIYFDGLPKLNDVWYYFFNENKNGYQPFWLILNGLVKEFGGNVYDFQMLHAIIFNTLLYIYLKRETKYSLTFLLFFYCSFLYFYFAFEIQRESLAIGFFLINIKNLENNNWVKYYLLAIVSFMFHMSAIVIFIFPLFKLVRINRKIVVTLVLIGIPLTFLKSTFLNFFSIFLVLDSMKAKADVYSQGDFSTIGLLSFYFVRVILPLPFVLFLSRKKNNEKPNVGLLFGFIIISIFAQIIVGFERFINYIYIWIIVEFINEMYSIRFKKLVIIRKYIYRLSFIGMLSFIILFKIFSVDNYGNKYLSIFFPYENVFTKQKNEEREVYLHNLWGW
ncbi:MULTISPECIES: EpsG family protein [Empedobacter]|uniref:EpsG family protein n=1 Tax=Empedobacter TaxID=59734 RepID=UPI000571A7B8|nr:MULTISPECIES: EpsG family protein [Empedobacter]